MGQTLSCNFCGKSRNNVFRLIVSGDVAVCDQCVDICQKVLHKEKQKAIKIDDKYINHVNPIEIKKYLDRFVVGQDEAKKGMSVAVASHYKRLVYDNPIRLDKSNVLILGPSGSGKTFLVKNIAKFLNVPFATSDATTFTEAGYVGDDVESIISKLVQSANGDIEQAERGIVFIDEVDKITKKSGIDSKDPNGAGVQSALLKLVEGTIVKVTANGQRKHPGAPLVEVDTSNILFIVGGAFVGFSEIVAARLKKKAALGFTQVVQPTQVFNSNDYLPDDFIKYGLIPEFIGRFPSILNTLDLNKDQLVEVLNATEDNLLDQYKFYFQVDNVELEFTDECIHAIAQKAIDRKIGVRGLRNIIDKLLMEHNFNLPTYKSDGVRKLIFSKQHVENNSLLPNMILDELEQQNN